MVKKMLGETIYRLRKEKGFSQDELGKMVGVSNKAVSKWETYDANPEITLLPLLAKVLGVTADELLTDKKSKAFGMEGTVIQTTDEYEFVSDKKAMNKLPYLHIHIGKKIHTSKEKARGIIAIGNNAKGIISIGFFSTGIFSLGVFSMGLFTAGVVAIGLTTFGILAIGGTAFGVIAVGLISFGAVVTGLLSYGAILVSFHANVISDGLGIRKHIA
jgi:transcriptional regulator with XRE-family HTH domain